MVADNINHTGAGPADEHRRAGVLAAEPRLVARLRPRHARTRTCPASWSSAPPRSSRAPSSGARASCPAPTRGRSSATSTNPIANLSDPSGDPRRAARQARRARPAQRAPQAATGRSTASSTPASRRSSWPSACSGRRRRPSTSRARAPRRNASTASATRRPTCSAGSACWPAGSSERGVRFVQLFDAPANNAWDHHSGLRENLPKRCAAVDRPIAGAAARPEGARAARRHARPLGRRVRPHADRRGDQRPRAPPLRLHHVAGRRRRPTAAIVHGATDEFGWHAVQDKVHVHDLHATILHLMGLDHERADLPLRRPRLPPHRRPRPRRPSDPRGLTVGVAQMVSRMHPARMHVDIRNSEENDCTDVDKRSIPRFNPRARRATCSRDQVEPGGLTRGRIGQCRIRFRQGFMPSRRTL